MASDETLTDSWIERVQEVVDEAHAQNWGGEHREGFCKACANAYLVAQHAVPRADEARRQRDELLEAIEGCALEDVVAVLHAARRRGSTAAPKLVESIEGLRDTAKRIREETAADGD